MRNTYGSQQSDAWLRNRIGRIPGSRIVDVCSYLVIKSRAGEPSAKRNSLRMDLIAERLTGRAKDHYVSPQMEHGTDTESEAVMFYERALRTMCAPVGFVLHPKYDFTGSSPDALVGTEGVLEVKCPDTTTHLEYIQAGVVPEQYLPQIAWEMACTERKWADFVSYDPRIQDQRLRFFYRRTGRDELEWKAGKRVLKGEAVIDYFTSEVLKLNAEIEYWFAEHNAKPIAPFPVELVTEDGEVVPQSFNESNLNGPEWSFLDQTSLAEVP